MENFENLIIIRPEEITGGFVLIDDIIDM